jgi:hypothetical protein
MNNYDWDNAFPKPPENFHTRLCSTLNGLEKEKRKMKRKVIKRSLIIAAAVIILGVGAFASSGKMTYIIGTSSSYPDYTKLPTAEQSKKVIGFVPKLISEFSNGYTFDDASIQNNSIISYDDNTKISVVDENGGKYKSIMLRYKNNDDEILLDAFPAEYSINSDDVEKEIYNGISIKYTSYTGKYVPNDYKKTEQDLKDEADGKIIFSYGTDDVEIIEVQGVDWIKDDISYNITAMDSPLSETELIDMAKEVIDF